AYVLNNPLLYNDPFGLDTTRGNTPKPKPDAGDVWIPDEGPEQIFDTDRGWAPIVELTEVVVSNGSNDNNNTSVSSRWSDTYFYSSTILGTVGSYYGFKGNFTHID